jgi:hypothetical protein
MCILREYNYVYVLLLSWFFLAVELFSGEGIDLIIIYRRHPSLNIRKLKFSGAIGLFSETNGGVA